MDKRQEVLNKLADFCVSRISEGFPPVAELELYLEHTRTDGQHGVLLGEYGLETKGKQTTDCTAHEWVSRQLQNS